VDDCRVTRGGRALRFATDARIVDAERVYAALSAYLLAGIFLGNFYWVLKENWPGRFAAAGDFSRMTAIYFSFVTLSALGYGDILPRSDVARGPAIVEESAASYSWRRWLPA
jgi:hypothetical protein